jgi:hypothetical protein
MLNITKRDVLIYHNRIVNRAKRAIKQNHVNRACKELINSSIWAYKFNAFYLIKNVKKSYIKFQKKHFWGRIQNLLPEKIPLFFYDSYDHG